MADLNAIIEQLDNLTLLEAAQLSKMLQEKWGVSAVAPIRVNPQPFIDPDGGEVLTGFDVVLVGFEGNKIKVIKAVRKLTNLGLRDAKAAVDEAPTTLREAVGKEEAEAVKAEIEKVGGKVEIHALFTPVE